MVVIPGILEKQKDPFTVVRDHTGEVGGNGGRFRPGTTPSPGAQGSMGAVPGLITVATSTVTYPINHPDRQLWRAQ